MRVTGSALGPAMVGAPVSVVGEAPPLVEVEAGAVRYMVGRDQLEPARLWIARGMAWQGPYGEAGEALAALEAISPPGTAERLSTGLESALGASVVAGGWRYRLAWSGEEPPGRYTV